MSAKEKAFSLLAKACWSYPKADDLAKMLDATDAILAAVREDLGMLPNGAAGATVLSASPDCVNLRHVCGGCGFKWPERSAYDELMMRAVNAEARVRELELHAGIDRLLARRGQAVRGNATLRSEIDAVFEDEHRDQALIERLQSDLAAANKRIAELEAELTAVAEALGTMHVPDTGTAWRGTATDMVRAIRERDDNLAAANKRIAELEADNNRLRVQSYGAAGEEMGHPGERPNASPEPAATDDTDRVQSYLDAGAEIPAGLYRISRPLRANGTAEPAATDGDWAEKLAAGMMRNVLGEGLNANWKPDPVILSLMASHLRIERDEAERRGQVKGLRWARRVGFTMISTDTLEHEADTIEREGKGEK